MKRIVVVGMLVVMVGLLGFGTTSRADVQVKDDQLDPQSLPVEFNGGQKLVTPVASSAKGSVYVSVDAGHGKGYGSECPNGCYTGAQPTPDYIEDEMNRKVALQFFNDLDASPDFYPAVSRWIQNNDREAADWDWYSGYPLESGKYAGDHMFKDKIPYTTNPDLTWRLNDCDSCKDNKKASIYDRPAHANGLTTGSARYGKIMVSIHFDISASGSGGLVYVQNANTQSSPEQYNASVALATAICKRLYTLRFGGTTDCNGRVLTGNFAVLRELFNTLPNGQGFPGVLIEAANLNSTSDRAWLGTGAAQVTRLNQIGDAIYSGVADWHSANN